MLKNFKIVVNDMCVFEDNIDVIFQNKHMMRLSLCRSEKPEIIYSVNINFKTDKSDELDRIIALCMPHGNKKIILDEKEFFWDDGIDITEIPEKYYSFFLRDEH